jgi:hypothetical protein
VLVRKFSSLNSRTNHSRDVGTQHKTGFNMDEKVLELYKPLINQIEKINLFDSLYLIWCYSRNYSFNEPFPTDFELRNSFNQTDELWIRRMK